MIQINEGFPRPGEYLVVTDDRGGRWIVAWNLAWTA